MSCLRKTVPLMPALLLILVLLMVFAVYGVAGHLDGRVRRHGPHALAWRWFSGAAHHGKPLTDRGWLRPGRKALTPTGHAHRRYYLPRWQHATWRTGYTLVAAVTGAGLLLQQSRTLAYLAVTGGAGCAYGGVRGWGRLQSWEHRRNYVRPLHVRLASKAGIPVAARPESWLEIPRDRSYAVLTWPQGAPLPKPQERDEIASAAASTLGMGGARKTWQLTGPEMKLHLTLPVPCPAHVTLRGETDEDGNVTVPGILEEIRTAGVNDLILGIGQESRVTQVSLQNDSPHLALSADSGKGKSVVVRCILPQVLLRGGIAAILDNKLVSHPWARGLPNVAYCDDIAKIHDFLVYLDDELDRRARFIRGHTDVYGNLTGNPGPRMMIVLEELNLMMNRLRTYWAELLSEDKSLPKDMRENLPAMSPAIRAMENASYIGRELKVHLLFVSQRLSAKATAGSGDVRMNMGTRILAGYDAATWDMLVGKETPMPPASKIRGRMQVNVKGGTGGPVETQIAFLTHEQARQLAESGTARVPWKLRHLTEFDGPDVPAAEAPEQPDLLRNASQPQAAAIAAVPHGAGPVRNWTTVRQAQEAGMLPRTWTKPGGAFRTAKSRAKKAGIPVPEVKGMRGTEAAYDAIEFADFIETITAAKERKS